MIYTDQAQLNDALAYWQKALRLQDWTVVAEVVPGHITDYAQGDCSHYLKLKEACIRLADPKHRRSNSFSAWDSETTLVHELLHLHFAPFRPDEDETPLEFIFWEQAIEQIAKAIVAINRRGS